MTDAFTRAGRGWGLTFPGVTRNPLTVFGPWLRLDYFFVGPRLAKSSNAVPNPAGNRSTRPSSRASSRCLRNERGPTARTARSRRKNPRVVVIGCIVFVLAFDLAFVWQRTGGAYQSEFGGHPDEAAHVRHRTLRARRARRGRALRGGRLPWLADPRGQGVRGRLLRALSEDRPRRLAAVFLPRAIRVDAAAVGASRTVAPAAHVRARGGVAVARLSRVARGIRHGGRRRSARRCCSRCRWSASYYGMVMAETLSALLMFGAMLAFGRFPRSREARRRAVVRHPRGARDPDQRHRPRARARRAARAGLHAQISPAQAAGAVVAAC